MHPLFLALIVVFGWGTWLAPSQKVAFASQRVRNLYVVVTNLAIATVVALWQGSVWKLTALFKMWITRNYVHDLSRINRFWNCSC